jgi:hypothetical protein
MKSGAGGKSHSDDDDADDGLEPRHEIPRPPGKGERPAGELDDFDEEDFDDEFDDDFEEELEDEYELSEFGELTEDDLADEEEADVTAIGDFVDEDAEPDEPLLEDAGAAAEPEDEKTKSGKGGQG